MTSDLKAIQDIANSEWENTDPTPGKSFFSALKSLAHVFPFSIRFVQRI